MIDDRTTVLVSASPIPSHPSTEVIDATLASVRSHLPRAEVLVLCDGVPTEVEHRAGAYRLWQRRLAWDCLHRHPRTTPVIAPDHLHQAEMTRRALDLVDTPLVLYVEHDTPLLEDLIDWDSCGRAIGSGALDLIRFSHEATILEPHRYLMIDQDPVEVDGVPVVRTVQWSQRPHLASTAYYRTLLDAWFSPTERSFIEDRMHGVVQRAWAAHRGAGWDQHRLAIYHPPGASIARSTHLDGRAGDPKVAT